MASSSSHNLPLEPVSVDGAYAHSLQDPEKGCAMREHDETFKKESTFKGLGWLDRFLAVWIFLAMAVGIILGNFVPNTGPALQKGEFVGVSIPISRFMSC